MSEEASAFARFIFFHETHNMGGSFHGISCDRLKIYDEDQVLWYSLPRPQTDTQGAGLASSVQGQQHQHQQQQQQQQ
jgi:hypothetical protein